MLNFGGVPGNSVGDHFLGWGFLQPFQRLERGPTQLRGCSRKTVCRNLYVVCVAHSAFLVPTNPVAWVWSSHTHEKKAHTEQHSPYCHAVYVYRCIYIYMYTSYQYHIYICHIHIQYIVYIYICISIIYTHDIYIYIFTIILLYIVVYDFPNLNFRLSFWWEIPNLKGWHEQP